MRLPVQTNLSSAINKLANAGNPTDTHVGWLGNGQGVVIVPNSANNTEVYVRIIGQPGIKIAFNPIVPNIDNLPVEIGYFPSSPAKLQIIRQISFSPGQNVNPVPSLNFHHTQHEYGGADVVFISKRQYMPFRLNAYGFLVIVSPDYIYTNGQWNYYYPLGATDLTALVPSSGSRYVLVSINPDGSTTDFTTGSVTMSLALTDIPVMPVGDAPVGAIRLYSGQTGIYEYTDILDLRGNPFLGITGSVGGGGLTGSYVSYNDPQPPNTFLAGPTIGALPGLPNFRSIVTTDLINLPIDQIGPVTDTTARNSSTGSHGFLPKLDNDSAHYLNGQGAWATPAGGTGDVATDNIWQNKGDIAIATGTHRAGILPLGTDGQVLTVYSTGTFGVRWASIPINEDDFVLNIDGSLGTGTSVGSFIAIKAMTIEKVYLYGRVLGSASSTIVDVHKNGTTIFTTQGNRPSLAFNDADNIAVSGTPDVTSLAIQDVLSIDIDQIATGAIDLTVVIAVSSAGSGGGGGGGSGNVTGPGTSADNAVARFDGTNGQVIQNSLVTIDDSGNIDLITGTFYKIGGSPHSHAGLFQTTIFTFEGPLSIYNNQLRIYNTSGFTRTISKVFLSVDIAPTGAAIIVDLHKNAVTIFTNQANRPQIAATANTGFTTTIDIATWADGEYLQMQVDQVGSVIVGSYLTVHILWS